MSTPALIVHGGAGDILGEEQQAHRAGCRAAFEAGWHLLELGRSALDAVEAAVRMLENDPAFDAGVGSVLNSEGEIELDAMIMNGENLRLGAVAAVRGIANPVTLARHIMEDTAHNILVGEGARQYASQIGLPLCSQAELAVPREVARYNEQRIRQRSNRKSAVSGHDTVGAVAIDRFGNIAAATSTGGIRFKLPGRVGDSPLVGSGAYADNLAGGASATGHGETIMRVLLSKTATDAMAAGLNACEAAMHSITVLDKRVQGQGGIIVVDRTGRVGFAHNTPQMAVAWRETDGRIQTAIDARQSRVEGASLCAESRSPDRRAGED
jgi:beta-aspartyl-peptidase (threonine type)